jgi:hypothetical protein
MAKLKAKQVKQHSKFLDGLKFFGMSLFDNATCVSAKDKPWWSAVILGLVSVILAVIPVGSVYFRQSGSDFFGSTTYGLENSLVDFDETLTTKNLSMKVDAGTASLSVDQAAWKAAFPAGYYAHTRTYDRTYIPTSVDENSVTSYGDTPVTEKITEVDLAVYYINESVSADFQTAVKAKLDEADPNGNATYSVNCFFFGPKEFVAIKIPTGSTSYKAKRTGFYTDMPSFDLKDFSHANMKGEEYPYTYATKNGGNVYEYTEATLNAWKGFFDASWNQTRITSGWKTSGIFVGVYAGVVLFLGLMIFLMTRGKNNPYRIYTFWETQKISYWAAFSPAVLSLIFGFGFSSYAMLLFIFFDGLRVMWLSMRTLQPNPQQ